MARNTETVELCFQLEQRINGYALGGNEWILKARVYEGQWWIVWTWDKHPSQETVNDIKLCVRQSVIMIAKSPAPFVQLKESELDELPLEVSNDTER